MSEEAAESNARPGLFIVCEGIDGCGKQTQAGRLVTWLFGKNKRHHVLYTREPGRSDDGVEIRRILKEEQDPYQRGVKLAQLFVNDRKEHVEKLIVPVLEYGGIAVSDRYWHSTKAYQQTQGVPLDELVQMHKGLPVPDLTMLFDLPVEEALRRVASDEHREYKEVFEKKDFQEELRKKYLDLVHQLSAERIVVVDANRKVEDVFKDVVGLVEPLLYKVA